MLGCVNRSDGYLIRPAAAVRKTLNEAKTQHKLELRNAINHVILKASLAPSERCWFRLPLEGNLLRGDELGPLARGNTRLN